MDLRVEEIIDQPYASVQKALLADPGKWLPSLANDAGKRLITELAVHIGSARVARTVEVEVAPPTIYPDRSEIFISWKSAGMPSLFPELRGQFELAAVEAGRSRLSFEASYEPPGRLAGQLVDQALMHRVAEASVREFVLRTAEALGRRAKAVKQD
ncbi:MAG: hypothetical protein M3O95_11920 [Candidatus Dormibacteraeota bacterium]|jgi:ribosome-associated toxin RatA of RatAB toxin-antitoxin module|nr:hypothetical protein [Candidatus Dormibacteraeota bacterium]